MSPDLVWSSDLPGLVGASLGAGRLGVPHLHDCHELYLESTSIGEKERRALAPVERHFMSRANRVFAVNASIAGEYAKRYGVEPTVVRNCTDYPTESASKDIRHFFAEPESIKSTILYQGGLSVGRGLDVIIPAMARMGEGIGMVLLGYGPLEHELHDLVTRLELHDRVKIVSAVPPEELLAYTRSATVGVIPYQPVSVNNFLTLPNKVFEYTSVGLPIVVSDVPELRRIAMTGAGRVYDSFDECSFVTAVGELLVPEALLLAQERSATYGRENTWADERAIIVEVLNEVHPLMAVAGGE